MTPTLATVNLAAGGAILGWSDDQNPRFQDRKAQCPKT
jgi:hypothetical protein